MNTKKQEEYKKQKVIKSLCYNDMYFFCQYLFKETTRRKLIERAYQKQITDKLNDVVSGKIKRLIINMPPRLGKTELAVRQFIPYGFSINPQCRFIHLSYSDELALGNSAAAKEYIMSDGYQKLWNVGIKKDAKAKKKWDTIAGGGVYATSTGGQITGFGAGGVLYDDAEDLATEIAELEILSKTKFAGALIIDDPHKVEDSFSEVKLGKDIRRWEDTIKNRLNSPDVPIIIIMQRLHESDLCGHVIENSHYTWDILTLKGLTDEGVSICENVISTAQLLFDKKNNPRYFSAQYQQEPAPLDGNLIKREYLKIIPKQYLPSGLKLSMFVDGAFTEDKQNDPTGVGVFGYSASENVLYMLYGTEFWKELPEAVENIIFLANYFKFGMTTTIHIEPKASGQALIPTLRKNTKLPIAQIRGKMIKISKIERVNMVLDMLATGRLRILGGEWNESIINQLIKFPNAKHDEYVDIVCYAIYHYFSGFSKLIS
jgi:phage terminase large subunit-like protein